MYLIYDEANCVSARTERLYAKCYPNRIHPDCKIFERLDQRIRNSDCLMSKSNVDAGRNRRIRTIETEERIVKMLSRTLQLVHVR